MNTVDATTYLNNRIHPHKFALWVGMGSILMMFASLTSAYIVRQAAGNWLEFGLPRIFYFSTLVIVLSSMTLHYSYRSFVKEEESKYKIALVVSFILGLAFVVLQYYSWMALFNQGIDLKGNPSGSFLYVITGLHALHVLGGIAALVVAMIHAFTLKFKVTYKRKIRFELVNHYWHFVDLLWIYLFIFLIISR